MDLEKALPDNQQLPSHSDCVRRALRGAALCRDASSGAQPRASPFPADRQTLWCVNVSGVPGFEQH